MKHEEHDVDPLVLEASMTGDVLDLALTPEGMAAFDEALEMLRETDPQATYDDVLQWMLESLIEKLEGEMN